MRAAERDAGIPWGLFLVLFLFAPVSVGAQTSAELDGTPRLHAGMAIAVAQPRGEFGEYVSVGGGLHGFFRVNLDESGVVGLRVHGGFLNYGNETKRVCLSSTVGCRIEVDLTTSNNIFLLGLGPEIGVPLGSARLYGNTTLGLGYFSTDSSVGGITGNESFAQTRNYGDGGFSWSAGGGVELPLGEVQQQTVSLDFGLGYQGNGRRDYLTRGGITDNEDGTIELDVKRSDANFLVWRLGISVGVRQIDQGGR